MDKRALNEEIVEYVRLSKGKGGISGKDDLGN